MSYAMEQITLPLVEEIDAFIGRTGMSPITFGRKALNDPHFVNQLRAGRRTWPTTEESVRNFMSTYRSEEEAKAA